MRMPRLIVSLIMSLVLLATSAHAQARASLLVSAAASLSDAFREIGAAFMAENPDVKVEFNFAASGALLRQMELGAPVDVLASADMRTMVLAEDKDLVLADSVTTFASNSLVLILPEGSRLNADGPDALLSGRVARVAVGNPETVPAGRYAKEALMGAGVWNGINGKLVLAENVRQVLDYVRRGEVDAGIVYATDAAAAKGSVRIAARLGARTPVRYPAAVAKGCGDRAAAARFLDFLDGKRAAAILKSYGFGSVVR